MDYQLLFYDIMDYEIPKNSEYFKIGTNFDDKPKSKFSKIGGFSWDKKNKYIDIFIKKINKYGKLYRSLPFVSEIFLCNSITFNSLKEDSDIDIFIITDEQAIRRARLFSAIFFKILGEKRSMKNKKQKFCLSFYITKDHKNLENILLKDSIDIYLGYRLAHLVPLYQENKDINGMFKYNENRFNKYFPNHPKKYNINIGNKNFYGRTRLKTILEFIFSGKFGNFVEKIIKIIRTPILKKKIANLGEKGKGIIVNDNMLKFYEDKRLFISKKFEKATSKEDMYV